MTDNGSPADANDASAQADEFPIKLRVHALARKLGITSREVLAHLAEIGHGARSPQSSIDREVAYTVRDRVTGESPDTDAPDTDAPVAEAPDTGVAETEATSAETTEPQAEVVETPEPGVPAAETPATESEVRKATAGESADEQQASDTPQRSIDSLFSAAATATSETAVAPAPAEATTVPLFLSPEMAEDLATGTRSGSAGPGSDERDTPRVSDADAGDDAEQATDGADDDDDCPASCV